MIFRLWRPAGRLVAPFSRPQFFFSQGIWKFQRRLVSDVKGSKSNFQVPDGARLILQQQEIEGNRLLETARYVTKGSERSVGLWLLSTAGLVSLVICYGGLTRLTESGLSMTDWNFQGRRLPWRESEWEKEFDKYKGTLEYTYVHHGMSLNEFKVIYFHEWFHRMLARISGIFFTGGVIYFGLVRRVLSKQMMWLMTGLMALFGSQGLLGWWMVKSGFEERTEQLKTPRVSPYRLFIHLSAASLLFAALLWPGFALLLPPSAMHLTAASCAAALQARKVAAFLAPLAPLTFLSGAFVAGNDAGQAYNTWPKMIDRWIPKEVQEIPNNWRHIFENDAVVQFDHRMLAYATVAASGGWFLYMRRLPISPKPRRIAHLTAQTSGLQVILGIVTLLLYVPVPMGVLHQALGLGVMGAWILSLHTLRLPLWYLRTLKAA